MIARDKLIDLIENNCGWTEERRAACLADHLIASMIANGVTVQPNDKTTHIITLVGCDDVTEFAMECTASEFEFLRRVAIKAKETSTYRCMPTIRIDFEPPKEVRHDD